MLDITSFVLLGTVIAGITELLNRLRAGDYWVVASIATSAIIGGIFGYFQIEATSIVQGIAVGFAISGTMALVGSVGKKSTPQRSDVLGEK